MQYMQYPAGRSPSQLAFDGTNIWVLNFVNDGTVTKLRASDGQPLGVYPVGPWPSRLVTDGFSVWVSSRSGTTRLRASDGVPLNWPANETVMFDGKYLWTLGSEVARVRPSDGAVEAVYPTGFYAKGVFSDRTHVWVFSWGMPGRIAKFRISDGAALSVFNAPEEIWEMQFDGTSLWFTDESSLNKMNPDTGVIQARTVLSSRAAQLAFSKKHAWVGHGPFRASRFRLSDGTPNGLFRGDVDYYTRDLLFDGENIWLTSGRDGYDVVTKVPNPDLMAVEVTSDPYGQPLSVDGESFNGRKTYYWPAGSVHTIAAPVQLGSGSTRMRFDNWTDGGQATHTITVPDQSISYTATFRKQHLLTTYPAPPAAGSISISPSSTDGFYDENTNVQLTAVAIPGARLQQWVGHADWSSNPITATMSAPRDITAIFASTSSCSFTLASSSATITANGGLATVNVTSSHVACRYTVSSSVDWVFVTPYPSAAGLMVQPNPSPTARSATLTIAGNTFTIHQAAADCGISIQPSTATVPAAGGPLTINVTATSSACTWTSVSNAFWAVITSGSTGTGNATVIVQVQPNPTTLPRATTLLIAGNGYSLTQLALDTPPVTEESLRFVPVTPCRLLETRSEYNYEGRTGAFGPPYLKAGETRTIVPANSTICSIPTTARAFVLNITLIPRSGVDYVTLYPGGAPRPDFFSIRSPSGQTVANQAIVPSGNGSIQIYTTHDTDMLLDISGYFTDALPTATNLVFYPLTPCRVIETRAAYRTPAGPFGPPTMAKGESRRFRFPSSPHCTIPDGAAAYSVTLTAVPPQPLPYMTAWAAGSVQPNVSSINSFAGRTLANNIIVPASANGEIDIYAFDRTDFLADINGYFAPDNGQGLFYHPVTQCRASDAQYADDTTRNIAIPTAGNCAGIPASAKAYVINATAVPGGSPMPFLTLFPTGQPRPNASMLNAFEGQTITNTSIIPAGTNGSIDIYAFRRTRVVVDVSGYFSR